MRAQELEVLDHRMRPITAELAEDVQQSRLRLRPARLKSYFPFADIGLDIVEAFEEVDIPGGAPVFAVRDRLQAGGFLLGDHARHFVIFDLLECCLADGAAPARLARRLERGGAKEAADMIGAKWRGGALGHSLFSSPRAGGGLVTPHILS